RHPGDLLDDIGHRHVLKISRLPDLLNKTGHLLLPKYRLFYVRTIQHRFSRGGAGQGKNPDTDLPVDVDEGDLGSAANLRRVIVDPGQGSRIDDIPVSAPLYRKPGMVMAGEEHIHLIKPEMV